MSAMDESLYLCLDQGGHASRAVLIDARGAVQNIAYREIATLRDGVKVEHDPEELLASLQQAAAEVATGHSISLAGLATQRSSIVCWDSHTGAALSPVLSWQDRRAADWLKQFSHQESRIHDLTGLVLSPHYGVSKLVWCLEHLPAVAEAQAENRLRFGPLAAWLAGRLCGEIPAITDPANGSRTLLWDRRKNAWSAELLDLFGVPPACLPTAVTSCYAWGNIELADQSVPLTVVTGDQSAALFAFGKPDQETVYVNLGTGAFVQRAAEEINDSGRLLASIVYADEKNVVSVLEGTVNGAGAAVNKYAQESDIDIAYIKSNSSAWLDNFDADLFFINAVSGLGSPWWLPDADSFFSGQGSDEQHVAAILESIAFLVAVNLEAGNKLVAQPCRQIVATGGLAKVSPLLQRIADLSAAEVERTQVSEATALGLAYLIAGMPDDWPKPDVRQRFTPQPDNSLPARFGHWRSLMPPIA